VLAMGMARRETFYIGVDGTIVKIDRDVSPATSAQDMAANLGELGVAPASGS
jgi:thioredoxin-dependent peroxiredoxin